MTGGCRVWQDVPCDVVKQTCYAAIQRVQQTRDHRAGLSQTWSAGPAALHSYWQRERRQSCATEMPRKNFNLKFRIAVE
eukprot:1442771-Amphidinium_carterae.1